MLVKTNKVMRDEAFLDSGFGGMLYNHWSSSEEKASLCTSRASLPV